MDKEIIIKDTELLQKYTDVWIKVGKIILQKYLTAKPSTLKKFESKIKFYSDEATDFHSKKH